MSIGRLERDSAAMARASSAAGQGQQRGSGDSGGDAFSQLMDAADVPSETVTVGGAGDGASSRREAAGSSTDDEAASRGTTETTDGETKGTEAASAPPPTPAAATPIVLHEADVLLSSVLAPTMLQPVPTNEESETTDIEANTTPAEGGAGLEAVLATMMHTQPVRTAQQTGPEQTELFEASPRGANAAPTGPSHATDQNAGGEARGTDERSRASRPTMMPTAEDLRLDDDAQTARLDLREQVDIAVTPETTAPTRVLPEQEHRVQRASDDRFDAFAVSSSVLTTRAATEGSRPGYTPATSRAAAAALSAERLEVVRSVQAQIGDAVHGTLQHGQKEAELQLQPPEWGHVAVRIAMDQDRVQLSILTERPFVRAALQDDLQHLRVQLSQHGLQLGNAMINLGQHGGWARDLAQWRAEVRATVWTPPSAAVSTTTPPPATATSRSRFDARV